MIFGIGLPRSAGQTLQHCLSILGYQTVHSPGNNLTSCIHTGHENFVEVFAPVPYLLRLDPNAVFILNFREYDSWINSCHKVYQKSQQLNWNHPIWKYQLDQFGEFREDYEERALHHLHKFSVRYITWNIIECPQWDPLCDLLGVEEPEHLFPDVDRHGRVHQETNNGFGFPSPW